MFLINYVENPPLRMTFELLLLAALIIVFIISFCGLLQKIRQSYEDERLRTERATEREDTASLSEVYVNPVFPIENLHENAVNSEGVFPSTPPPYTDIYCDPPPKYEDIIKTVEDIRVPIIQQRSTAA